MASQRSHAQDGPAPAVDGEWQLVPAQCWRTSFTSVSWSYEPEKESRNVVCAKPPHYHLSLHNRTKKRSRSGGDREDGPPKTPSELYSLPTCRIAVEDDVLNEELIGVKNAFDVLRIYEQAVGFDCSPRLVPTLEDTHTGEKLRTDVSEQDVELGKERWNDLVDDLFGGQSLDKLMKEAKEKSKSASNGSKNLIAATDYFSRPSSPKTFQLNPSASSFVPLGSPTSTFSSSSSSSLSSDSTDHIGSFSFPSLMPSFPSLSNSKKEHQEYVNRVHSRSRTTSSDDSSVVSNERPSNGFLPSFLFDATNQRRRPNRISRTRAIVDQLRSQHQQDGTWTLPGSQTSSPTVSDFGAQSLSYLKSRLAMSDGSDVCSATPLLTEEDYQHLDRPGAVGWSDNVEGWTVPPAPAPVDPETKRTRSKELLMTLRRRTDSLTSNANAAASLVAARSLGTLSASTPPSILGNERLVESPKPCEESSGAEHDVQTDVEEEEDWFESPDGSSQLHQDVDPSHFIRSNGGAPAITMRSAIPNVPTPLHPSTHSYHQAYTKPTSAARYPHTHPASAVPYNLLGYPLPVSGVSANVGIPMTMPMGGSRNGPQAPVQVPVQMPVQYSTLMHLRIMQQMQMMRNNMGMAAGTSTGVTR